MNPGNYQRTKIRAKVMSPGGDAMRFIHHELDEGEIGEKRPKTWVAQAFWRDVQEPEAAVSRVGKRLLLIHCSKAASSPCLRPGSTLALRGRGFHPALDQGDAHAPLEPQHKVPRPNGRGLNG